MIVAALLTVGFYAALEHPALAESKLHRYTAEHAVEYVIVAFMIWGCVDVIARVWPLRREWRAVKTPLLPPITARVPASAANDLRGDIQSAPDWLQNSRIGLRLSNALAYVAQRGSAEGLSEYLGRLSDDDADRSHGGFALVRFICWVTPVLGFLGTVIHFGTALGGMSSDDMAERLPYVVSEMGTAFDTTTAALVAAVTMMFALFIGERSDKNLLHAVDRRTADELLDRFATDGVAPTAPAAAPIANMDAALFERHSTVLLQAVENLQRQFDLRQQQALKAWQLACERLYEEIRKREADQERRLLERLVGGGLPADETAWPGVFTGLREIGSDFRELNQNLTVVLRDGSTQAAALGEVSERLRQLQLQQLDPALHQLTAAIHLLTARASRVNEPRAA
jgi:biopolymer transport protein ExbB/TolQ